MGELESFGLFPGEGRRICSPDFRDAHYRLLAKWICK
jgi:hypothetical protein